MQADLDEVERGVVVSSIRHFEGTRYELHAYAVMNDHVHVILRPLGHLTLEAIIHSWKSYTANRLQRTSRRTGRAWQEEYFDKIVRSKSHYQRLIRYVLENPIRRWPDLQTYRWAGLGEAGKQEAKIP